VTTTGSPMVTIPAGQSGRRELAQWLADPANPLPARVTVNRIWKHLLGEGLVRTVDNFGRQGETPSHPELLDNLALQFVQEGWSVKKLVRAIMLSRVTQLAASKDAALLQADPDNRLFGRANRRRVEAEVLRDAILLASGKLERGMGGPVVAHLAERAIDNNSNGGVQQLIDTSNRRSVYLPVIRNDLPKIFEVFDFADPDVTTGQRDATTVSTQALFLMNSPFVMDQAQQTAKRLLAEPGDDSARLTALYRRALGRTPTAQEAAAALRFLADYRQIIASKSKTDPDVQAWSAVCLALFGCTEFRFVE